MKIIKPYYIIETPIISEEEILVFIEKAGRTAYKSEDRITSDSAKKFIASIIKSGHESVIEHFTISVRFICDRGVSHELVRHRIASITQESSRYCVDGSTKLSYKNPHYDLSIDELYNKKNDSKNGQWKRINIKEFNYETGCFTYTTIQDIFYNEIQDTYELETELGYKLNATSNHEIFTNDGFKKIQNLNVGDLIGVNGSNINTNEPLYRNKDWLYYQYNILKKTSTQIEKEFGYNHSTIKKWVKKFDLPSKPRSYFNIGKTAWNKGLTRENSKGNPSVLNQINALKEYHWDGNKNIPANRKERIKKLSIRTFHKAVEEKCAICGSMKNLNVHHKDKNRYNNDLSNLITVCSICHGGIHNNSLKNVYFDKIIKISHKGKSKVYDLTTNSRNHNYVANGIIVHNCNYSKDKFNREITVIEPFFWKRDSIQYLLWKEHCEDAELTYIALLEEGATPEQARSVLPNSLKTEVFQTMNLREWRHFLKLRTSKRAHPQMRELVIPLLREFQSEFPTFFGDIITEE